MKIVIIGGTAAGTSAAAKARRMDKNCEIKILEKGEMISFGACGLPYFAGDFFSDPQEMISRTKEDFAKENIQVLFHSEVLKVNTKEKMLQVKNQDGIYEESYDKLMIATGASVSKLPFIKKDYDNLFYLRTLAQGHALKKALSNKNLENVAIIGGGFIGLELVEACLAQGKKVTVIEGADHLGGGAFAKEVTDLFAKEITKNGVALFLNEKVQEFVGEDTVTEVITEKNRFRPDMVILATGVAPNTKFLTEEFKKIKNGALVTEKTGETSVKDVYAAGDCATIVDALTKEHVSVPLATYANKLGRIVGENLVGGNKELTTGIQSMGLKLLSLEAGKTGLSEGDLNRLNIPFKKTVIEDVNHTNYYPGQGKLLGILYSDPETHVILGGQIIGNSGAVLRVDVLALAVTKKVTTEELGYLDLIYAPTVSTRWDFNNILGNVASQE